MENERTSAAKGPGGPLRPAGRAARAGSGQHDAVPCLLGHDVPVRHLDGLVRGNAGASVAADHLLGVHSAVRLLCAALGRRIRCGAVLPVFAAGALVTVVTLVFMPEDRVVFGVLTFLGSAMLLTGVLEPLLKKIPPAAGFAISAVLFALTRNRLGRALSGFWQSAPLRCRRHSYANCVTAYFRLSIRRWFYSTDYFALLPWLFLFWAGYFLLRHCRAAAHGALAPLGLPGAGLDGPALAFAVSAAPAGDLRRTFGRGSSFCIKGLTQPGSCGILSVVRRY